MVMVQRASVSVFAGAICLAGAAEAEVLDTAGIVAALTGRTLVYDGGAVQEFRASGRTLYDAGQPSWGYWEARGDEYCSVWPPGGDWECYGVERDGETIVFVGRAGDRTAGRYADTD